MVSKAALADADKLQKKPPVSQLRQLSWLCVGGSISILWSPGPLLGIVGTPYLKHVIGQTRDSDDGSMDIAEKKEVSRA